MHHPEPTSVMLGSLHDRSASVCPDRTALIDGATGETVSYEQLDERIARAGNALADLGVDAGERVAILFPNELTFLYLTFGAARIGAVPVPLNVELPTQTLRTIVEDSGAHVLACSATAGPRETGVSVARSADIVRTLAIDEADVTESVADCRTVSIPAAMARASDECPPVPVDPDDPAIQPYTSGSTGRPKGVVLSHGGVAWNVDVVARVRLLSEGDCGLVATPLYHKNAMTGIVKPFLYSGGTVVVLEEFDTGAFIEAVDRYDVEFTTGVPAMYQLLLDDESAIASHDVSSLEWGICGSDTVPDSLAEAFEESFGATLLEGYGLTEGGPVVTTTPLWGVRKQGSAGLPLPGVTTVVVDPDTGEELPADETGELLVSSPGLGRYHDRPEKTDAAFETRDGERYFRTGDLASKDEQGYHYIEGRMDDVIITGGRNVYPAEIEQLLAEHEAVQDVAVVGTSHDVKGEVPVAFVVANGDLSERALQEHAIQHGPAYGHPRRVICKSSLPLTGTGKVDRDALADEAEAVASDSENESP